MHKTKKIIAALFVIVAMLAMAIPRLRRRGQRGSRR